MRSAARQPGAEKWVTVSEKEPSAAVTRYTAWLPNSPSHACPAPRLLALFGPQTRAVAFSWASENCARSGAGYEWFEHVIYQAIVDCFTGCHEDISVSVLFDFIHGLVGAFSKDLVQSFFETQDLICLDLNI